MDSSGLGDSSCELGNVPNNAIESGEYVTGIGQSASLERHLFVI